MTMPAASTTPIIEEYDSSYAPAENSGVETAFIDYAPGNRSIVENPLYSRIASDLIESGFIWRFTPYSLGRVDIAREWTINALSLLVFPPAFPRKWESTEWRTSLGTPISSELQRALAILENHGAEFSSHTAAPILIDNALPESENPLLPTMRRIVAESAWENFADGMESALSRKIHSLIHTHGGEAIGAIGALIKNGLADAEAAEEILRQVGYSEDAPTYDARLELLVDCLFSPKARVRDAASLGIAGMDDPAAIDDVETALANEPTEFMRYSLTLILEQLRETEKEVGETKCRAS